MRQVVLDTEATGLDVNQGHRIIEIAAVQLVEISKRRCRNSRSLLIEITPLIAFLNVQLIVQAEIQM